MWITSSRTWEYTSLISRRWATQCSLTYTQFSLSSTMQPILQYHLTSIEPSKHSWIEIVIHNNLLVFCMYYMFIYSVTEANQNHLSMFHLFLLSHVYDQQQIQRRHWPVAGVLNFELLITLTFEKSSPLQRKKF